MDNLQDLIISHSWLVRTIVRSEFARVPPNLADFDDLISIGTIGLIRAAKKYCPTLTSCFASYAKHRIRGAIRDELRKGDTVSRTERLSRTCLLKAYERLEQQLHRAPDEIELAAELGVTLCSLQASRLRSVLFADREAPDRLIAAQTYDPGNMLLLNEQHEHIKQALGRLPNKYQHVLTAYYLRGMTLSEIAQAMHLTQPRVSQMHSRALQELRLRCLGLFMPMQETMEANVSTTRKHEDCGCETQGHWPSKPPLRSGAIGSTVRNAGACTATSRALHRRGKRRN